MAHYVTVTLKKKHADVTVLFLLLNPEMSVSVRLVVHMQALQSVLFGLLNIQMYSKSHCISAKVILFQII